MSSQCYGKQDLIIMGAGQLGREGDVINVCISKMILKLANFYNTIPTN